MCLGVSCPAFLPSIRQVLHQLFSACCKTVGFLAARRHSRWWYWVFIREELIANHPLRSVRAERGSPDSIFYIQGTGSEMQWLVQGYQPGECQVWMGTMLGNLSSGATPRGALPCWRQMITVRGVSFSQGTPTAVPGSPGLPTLVIEAPEWSQSALLFNILFLLLKLRCFSCICVPACSCHLPLLPHYFRLVADRKMRHLC